MPRSKKRNVPPGGGAGSSFGRCGSSSGRGCFSRFVPSRWRTESVWFAIATASRLFSALAASAITGAAYLMLCVGAKVESEYILTCGRARAARCPVKSRAPSPREAARARARAPTHVAVEPARDEARARAVEDERRDGARVVRERVELAAAREHVPDLDDVAAVEHGVRVRVV